jgi:hypothetical protein
MTEATSRRQHIDESKIARSTLTGEATITQAEQLSSIISLVAH